jgi:hypothetical protein
MPECTGPGSDDRFDPRDLDDIRERVVLPVVSSLIATPDLTRIDVGWGPREPILGFWFDPPMDPPGPEKEAFSSRMVLRPAGEQPTELQADEELWVLVAAAGSTWHSQIWQVESAEQRQTLSEVAWHLANQLEDWVCERVYWGEQAIARFVIPARRSGPSGR